MARKYNKYGANDKNYKQVQVNEVTMEFFETIVSHPQFDELMTMIEETISKPYDGGIVINNCWPEDMNNKQVGFLIWFIQSQYPQVTHSQFYGDNGLYVEIKNAESKIVSNLKLEDSMTDVNGYGQTYYNQKPVTTKLNLPPLKKVE